MSRQECDDSTGLYYYGGRFSAPWLGRWLNPDPIGPLDGLNMFAFVAGNPLRYRDAAGFAKKTISSKYLTVSGGGVVKPIPKKRPANQSSKGTQKKIAERLEGAAITLPDHQQDFVDDVKKNGKAGLNKLGLDMCHVTAVDMMKETTAAVLTKRGKLNKREKKRFKKAVEETLSSDDEEGREEIAEQVEKMLDPNTHMQEVVDTSDTVLERLNRSSRDLLPDRKRPNRGIGNSKDPWLLEGEEEERSKGIGDNLNEVREVVGKPPLEPRFKANNGSPESQSSSVDSNPKNAFTTITGTFDSNWLGLAVDSPFEAEFAH